MSRRSLFFVMLAVFGAAAERDRNAKEFGVDAALPPLTPRNPGNQPTGRCRDSKITLALRLP